MKPCLVHYDMHEGNISMKPVSRSSSRKTSKRKKLTRKKKNGKGGLENVKAVVDWEFGGIVDPRLDLVKFVLSTARNRKRMKRKVEQKRRKNRNRSKGGTSKGGSSSDSDSSSDSESSGSDSEDEYFTKDDADVQKLWKEWSKKVYGLESEQVGPWFQFAALLRAIDVVFYRAIVRLLSSGAVNQVPRCDLDERGADARFSAKWLVHHNILVISQFPELAYSLIF